MPLTNFASRPMSLERFIRAARSRLRLFSPMSLVVGMPAIGLLLTVSSAFADPATMPIPYSHETDIDFFQQELANFGPAPSRSVSDRMIDWARTHPSDEQANFWAARAKINGWTSGGVSEGLNQIHRLSDEGYSLGQAAWGEFLCFGAPGVPPNTVQGVALLRLAAERGNALALEELGAIELLGAFGVSPDTNAALVSLLHAVQAGDGRAEYWYGLALIKNDDENAGWAACRHAADAGDLRACALFFDQLPENQTETRLLMLQRGVIRGSAAMTRTYVANLLLADLGLTRDEPLAARLLWIAAQSGDQVAAGLQARARIQGIWGVPLDPERGYRELESLCGLEIDPSGASAYLLGTALIDGIAHRTDFNEGKRLLLIAADAKFPPALSWTEPAATNPSHAAAAGSSDAELRTILLWASRCLTTFRQTAHYVPVDLVAADRDLLQDYWYRELPVPPEDVISRTLLRAETDSKDFTDAAWAAFITLNGLSAHETPDKARELLDRATASDDGSTLAICGQCLQSLGPDMSERARQVLQTAANRGDPNGLALYGQLLANGSPGHASEYDSGVILIRKGIQRGSNLGTILLATLLEDHGNAPDALKEYEFAADACQPLACVRLQRLYLGEFELHGLTTRYKPKNAWERLFVRPMLLDYRRCMADAAIGIAMDGLNRDGVPDAPLARFLVYRAAESNDLLGEVLLASATTSGAHGFPFNLDRGCTRLELLTDLDPKTISDRELSTDARLARNRARLSLGQLLFSGPKGDRNRARRLINEAAEEHMPEALHWLQDHS